MRGTNLKNEKNEKNEENLPRNHFFNALRGFNSAEKSEPSKGTSRPLNEYVYFVHTKFQLPSSI